MTSRIPVLMAIITLAVTTPFAQTAEESEILPRATDTQLKALADSESYEYSIAIRENNGDSFEEIGTPTVIARKGSQAFVGLPYGDGETVDASFPSRVYCKAKVEHVKDGIAQVHVTLAQSHDVKKTNNETSWSEHKLSVNREVRLGDTFSVRMPASSGSTDSPTFEIRAKVQRYVPNGVH